LHEILSLGSVFKDSASDCIQTARVPPEEQTEGVLIFVANEAEKQFIGEGLPIRSGQVDAVVRNSTLAFGSRERIQPSAGRRGIHSGYLRARVRYSMSIKKA